MSSRANKSKLNIIQISKYDSAGGGASRVAEQLTDALTQNGHNVIHYTRGAAKGFNHIRRPLYGKRTKKMMGWMAKKGWVDVVPFELPRLLFNIHIWRADVIHFHDISGTLSPLTVAVLSWFKKVVWTLHDASTLTAGCIQPLECEKFKKTCSQCPQLGIWPLTTQIDRTSWLRDMKRLCIRISRVKYVSPSYWLADLFHRETGILPIVIRNGLDEECFHPLAWKSVSPLMSDRVKLLRNSTKYKLLLSASNFDDPNKGMDTALEIAKQCPKNKVLVVLVGRNSINEDSFECDMLNLGFIDSERDKAALISVCDGMLFCSKGENYPLILLEAIASGLAVYALPVGGVAEILNDHVESKVCSDSEELAASLIEAIALKLSMGKQKKSSQCMNLSWSKSVDGYLGLYR